MRRAFAALLATGACGALWSACFLDPYRSLTRFDDRVDMPRATDCGQCHVEIEREFRASRHARAWDDPAFVRATSGRALENCLGCHAPRTVYADGDPRLRPMHRDDGVTCVTCHFDGAVLAGPAPGSALVDPHPIAEERPLYRSAELCGKCHEGTRREWSAAPPDGRRTCQECHMRPVARTLTQATGTFSSVLVAFEDEFVGRAHTFDVAAIRGIDDAFDLRVAAAERTASGTRVRVAVKSRVPHLVPTGDFGFRRVRIALFAAGVETATDLFKETGRALVCGDEREFAIDSDAAAESVRVRILALDRDGNDVLVLERELALR